MSKTCIEIDVQKNQAVLETSKTVLEIGTLPLMVIETECEPFELALSPIYQEVSLSQYETEIFYEPVIYELETTPVGSVGPTGPQGAAGDLNYVHTQGAASTEWNIIHNLGKRPSVTVRDSIDRDVVVEILELTLTTAKLGLAYPTSGTAYLN